MPRAVEEILQEALQLPEGDRERIASSLLQSLDEAEAVEQAWIAEAERRCAEIDKGKVVMVPWEEVEKGLRDMISR